MPSGGLLVLVSRAHPVDFSALLAAVRSGAIRAAIDVFPVEPVAAADPLRSMPGLIMAPHRAAAVAGGRRLIGSMIVQDVRAIAAGAAPSGLLRAEPSRIESLKGTGNATEVADMAAKRK